MPLVPEPLGVPKLYLLLLIPTVLRTALIISLTLDTAPSTFCGSEESAVWIISTMSAISASTSILSDGVTSLDLSAVVGAGSGSERNGDGCGGLTSVLGAIATAGNAAAFQGR